MRFVSIVLLFFSFYHALCQETPDIYPADKKIQDYIPLLKNKKIGVIINQTSVIGNQSVLDVLIQNKVNVKKIFVPEHGFRGIEDAGANVENDTDKLTGIPIISLYGNRKKPTQEDLNDIETMVYDIQDVGVRFYTYISTLEYCMEACAENNKEFIVLDKPNPNGFYVAGPVLENENKSFVGMQKIPIVYGMTVGEYAKMLVGEKWFHNAENLDLKIVLCTNYTHEKKYKLPVAPSPNLRTMASIYAYPSLCLFEGTPISVGRGTDLPFGLFGCPEFAGNYNYCFTPIKSKGAKLPLYENKLCCGELIGDNETNVLQIINNNLYLNWLINAYNNFPEKDRFFGKFFKKLAGTSELENQIKMGLSAEEIYSSWNVKIDEFLNIRKKYLLYK